MTDLLAARSQMAMSLGFHIIFAMVGIAMPVLMVVAERRWHRTGDPIYLDLAHRWAKGTAILFAVGAVSGTVLSFELGLLWPTFMEHAGPVIGMPFSLEGFAFFTEAVFLGVYLYGWDRISRRAHLAAGWAVAVSGMLSGVFVVIANAWMNAPTGIRWVDGRAVDIDPIAAMMNPAALPQVLHMTLAAYASTGLVVAGIHAWPVLRHPRNAFHRRAFSVALLIGAPAALLQPLSGDLSARFVAQWQPVKLAAMEGHFKTERGAPLRIGGWPDEAAGETRYAIEIPYALPLLAFKDPHAEVKGLEAFPREHWPPVAIVHVAFQVMVGLGSSLALVSLIALWLMWRGRDLTRHRWLLRALVLAAPMGFICTEAGWIVTEVGRQPWIIYGLMRTADAVTPMPGLVVPFAVFTALYCVLGVVVAWLLYQQVLRSPQATEEDPGVTAALGPAELVAGIALVALTAYALLGGADFGGGVWDLLASGPRRREQRALIAEAIGPIWEANHVWLILVIVVLFTCFPVAFARLSIGLHVPLSLMLIGIVLRGSAFTFRSHYGHAGEHDDGAGTSQRWGRVFAIASVGTPVMLGLCVSAMAAGRLGPPGRANFYEGYVGPWLTPFGLGVGLLTLALFAFLAAVYLTVEAREPALREDFRRRALGAGAAVFVAAFGTLGLALLGAPMMGRGLTTTPWAPALHVATGAAAVAALWALWSRRFRLARVAAAAQVSLILWGWALAQYPYLIPPDLTIRAAAAPCITLVLTLWVLGAGALVLFPSLIYLFRVFKPAPR